MSRAFKSCLFLLEDKVLKRVLETKYLLDELLTLGIMFEVFSAGEECNDNIFSYNSFDLINDGSNGNKSGESSPIMSSKFSNSVKQFRMLS